MRNRLATSSSAGIVAGRARRCAVGLHCGSKARRTRRALRARRMEAQLHGRVGGAGFVHTGKPEDAPKVMLYTDKNMAPIKQRGSPPSTGPIPECSCR